jgi:hypothetical protein
MCFNLKCRILNLPLVLYGCETWSFRQRKKHRLRVLENRVLESGVLENRVPRKY